MSNANDDEPHLTPQIQEHYENEVEVLRLLVDLELRYRDYYKLYLCEIETQKILIERVWVLTQRYLLVISSGTGCRFPEVYTLSAEEVIINEYEEKLQVLRASNNCLKHSILELSTHCKEFYAAYKKLDKKMETPFILGDKHHRSIQHHKIMVVDIFNYFYASILKMKAFMHQLDPISLESIEDYRTLLKPCEEFEEYLMKRFQYCKCLHPRPTCPIEKLKCLHQRITNLTFVSRV
ncbi:uncharacterized protein LOC115621175 [Scaptodrosophila lebanonensis]|uniref:Uncharacterized protein LOC115621175 n=1 Tax=Drosophila lebanonensis TaxID=7225 RepID=A0A6J2T3N2_DROLE|nr:uncharacterized protein LOC115621175 [Scaptodrosophila lebanonensis]